MSCTGFPDDEDPNLVDEPECPKCGNILTLDNGEAHCEECSFHHEHEPPEPPDYNNYDGPTPYDHLG